MAISIDISEDYIRIIRMDNSKINKVKIKDFYELEIDKSFVQNGYIKNKIDLTLKLTEFLELNNLKNQDCFLTIKSSDSIVKDIILPKTNYKNLHKIILNQLKDMFESDLSKIYIDYAIVNEFTENKQDFYKIQIYSLPKTIVDDYKSLIMNIGLKPKSLDLSRNFIRILLTESKINDKKISSETLIFIGMDGHTVTITLISNFLTIYKKTFNIAEEIRREKIFESNKDKNKDKNSIDEFILEAAITTSYEIKEDDEITFLEESEDYDIENKKYISPIILKIEEELYKIIQFAMSLETGKNISNVFLYGASENIDKILDYIKNNIELPAEKIQKLSNFDYPENLDVSKFFICISNCLRK